MTKPPYRILVTGSRNWTDVRTVYRALTDHSAEAIRQGRRVLVIAGDARGADALAAVWAVSHAVGGESHPADWEKHGKAAGPIRNQEMVDLGADICLAFPLGESRGTRDCMRRAEEAGIPVYNFGDVS